jgi:hypothetical protein
VICMVIMNDDDDDDDDVGQDMPGMMDNCKSSWQSVSVK